MKSIQNTIKTSIWLSLCLMFTLISACKKDDAVKDLGVAPTSEQVKFSNTPTSTNANIINFKNESPGFRAFWDFGNGATAEGNDVQASYPLAGNYTVKLTIVTDGGYASSTKTVTIAATNPAMLTDPAFTTLSGGLGNPTGKT
ncbi:PKD domain-containing protein [Pedobacter sp. UC225_65]|uniref:PKD domain-containing protein n=1 Tax=Pedobacter sp. UC225_65 TaxID=3350173 RepID=UPI00366AF93B